MAKIFLPQDYVDNCNVLYDGFIRSYTDESHEYYFDIFPNMNYAVKSGHNDSHEVVVCDYINTYTSDFYYRFDLANSLIIFYLLCIVMFGLPLLLYTRLFKRFRP